MSIQNVALRRRAVLLTAEAREAEASNPDKALRSGERGVAARALAGAGRPRSPAASSPRRARAGRPRASSRGPGSSSPHPDLALVYAFAKPGEPPRERVKRVKHLASLTPGDIEGPIAVANAAIEAHEWQEARDALAPYLDDRPPARICTLMARIEAGELGDKGREREWLARALRAPRDRAWIADGYVSDRWLPVSPGDRRGRCLRMEGAGRCDRARRRHAGHRGAAGAGHRIRASAGAVRAAPRRDGARGETGYGEIVDVSPKKEAAEAPPVKRAKEAPRSTAEQRPKPAIFVPERPPDDPGVAQTETDESPTSLERLRAAQIR